ncbi:MAG: arginine decarboxylase [Bacteroidales bacterium]|nr:arginine decarboxylase [Bacteroidales bacterium]
MKTKYLDLIEQTFDFPQENFEVIENELWWNNIKLMDIIEQYGTPLKITYLPSIGRQIQKAKRMFNVAMAKVDYEGEYHYAYCTKSNHFSFVIEEALKHDIHIETSSAFDLNIIERLEEDGKVDKNMFIICNGFKRPQYVENISQMINNGFTNIIPVIDNKSELEGYKLDKGKKIGLGIRIASEEEPMFEFYTSRLGIRYNDVIPFYNIYVKNHPNFELKMLHFFINTGIRDSAYYWSELHKCVKLYTELKKIVPTLTMLNIGGGFPVKNTMAFDYDYEYMAEEIVAQIKSICEQQGVPEPDIFTEFGSYTVGQSGAVLYSILNQKQQNDREMWNMIDSSFMTTLPDIWAMNQRFILMSINHWDYEYQRVFLGGLTCDSNDYYNAEAHANAIFLPKMEHDDPLYIGFFHTGAYQESLGGYGGIQHCLIPAPKHILISEDEEGEYSTRLFAKEQSYKSMLKILGY